MNRYVNATGPEAEYEPGSQKKVLKNLLGITSKVEMDLIELEALIRVQETYYRKPSLESQRITADFIRGMHRDWLGGIYSWSGNCRTVELAKEGFAWPPAYLVTDNMAKFEADVLAAHTPCKADGVEAVSQSLAVVHAELLLIHPFREGNGRLARWLADLMAFQAGYAPPEYRFTGRGSRRVREQYLVAVIQGYQQNYEPLARFFEEALLS